MKHQLRWLPGGEAHPQQHSAVGRVSDVGVQGPPVGGHTERVRGGGAGAALCGRVQELFQLKSFLQKLKLPSTGVSEMGHEPRTLELNMPTRSATE